MKKSIALFAIAFLINSSFAQTRIIPGAERVDVYVPLLKGRSVAVFANQTSMVGNTHLVDTLVKRGVKVVKIFGPEHGFRGTADAGEKIGNYKDEKTGIPVISLYGTKRRPSDDDLKDVDIMIFDIQDVGVRFYTYISSLQEYIEAAFENSKPLLILDRPNPNGFYVDGPVLESKFKTFVGMQPVPIVYGLTIGEYGMMISGEKWLSEKANKKQEYYTHAQNSKDTPFHFLVIKCKNYDHNSKYVLPVKPSPNLPEIQAIYWYPSTCLFEGTALNEGRGTEKPFEIFGHPSLPKNLYKFTPIEREGAKDPKLKNQVCYGWNLYDTPEKVLEKVNGRMQLSWLINAYKLFPDKEHFFRAPTKDPQLEENYSFNKLAGNSTLIKQIKAGLSEDEIRRSWEPALTKYKEIRKKYLLYTP
jgi:uncharacterized protein YbbC (DUF1343 family)